MTTITVFGPLRLRHANDSVPMKLVVLDKIPTSPFLRFLFLEYHKYCHIFVSQNQERVV